MAANSASVVSEPAKSSGVATRNAHKFLDDNVKVAGVGVLAGARLPSGLYDVAELVSSQDIPKRFVIHQPVVVACSIPAGVQSAVRIAASHWMGDADVAHCAISMNGKISDLSANWDLIIGLPADECADGGLMMALHPYYRHALLEKLDMLFEGMEEGAAFGIFSTRLRCQIADCNNGWRWFDLKLIAESIGAECEPMCAMMVWDVHDQVMTEKQLRTAHIEAELAQRGRYEFLGHMSHELRTPLNAMLGFSEMIEQEVMGEVTNPHYKEYLANIRESGNLLLHRISDMVEIVNIEVGAYEINDEQLQLADVLQAAIRLHQHEAASRNIEVVIDGVLPKILLFADRVKIIRALSNIISNAVRFSPENAQVRVQCTRNNLGGLSIAVHDAGVGMSENHLATLRAAIAERNCLFQQSPEEVSVGLGLAVAKEFLELHEAHVRIDSVKGEGTSVYVGFPTTRVVSLETPTLGARRREAVAS